MSIDWLLICWFFGRKERKSSPREIFPSSFGLCSVDFHFILIEHISPALHRTWNWKLMTCKSVRCTRRQNPFRFQFLRKISATVEDVCLTIALTNFISSLARNILQLKWICLEFIAKFITIFKHFSWVRAVKFFSSDSNEISYFRHELEVKIFWDILGFRGVHTTYIESYLNFFLEGFL